MGLSGPLLDPPLEILPKHCNSYLSGTSGKQKHTHEWTSAKLNWPLNLRLFIGLETLKPFQSIYKLNKRMSE